MRKFLILALITALAGCYTPKKVASKFFELYPPKDSIEVKRKTLQAIVMLPARDTTITDSIPCPPGATDTVKVSYVRRITLPGVTDTVEVECVDTVYHCDNASLKAWYDSELAKASADAEIYKKKWKTQRRGWMAFWVLLGTILLLIFGIPRK